MDFRKLYKNLKNELTVFENHDSVDAWLKSRNYNITFFNYKDITTISKNENG